MVSVGQGKAADQKRGQRNKCRERGIPQTVQNEIPDIKKKKKTYYSIKNLCRFISPFRSSQDTK